MYLPVIYTLSPVFDLLGVHDKYTLLLNVKLKAPFEAVRDA